MKKYFALALLSCGLLQAKPQSPWFTGPLLAPLGQVVPYGDVMVRSYLYFIDKTGSYDRNWNAVSAENSLYDLTAQFQCFFGLTPWCDLSVAPQVLYNWDKYERAVGFGDLSAGLDFQLMSPDCTPYFPGIKFSVKEVFPTGRFNHLSSKKGLVDRTGNGTFATQLELVFYQVYRLSQTRWLSANYSAKYAIHTPVEIRGFNAYGGGFGAKGRVYPGNIFQAIASFELSLTRHWALALDNVYMHKDADLFLGNPGISFNGTLAEVGLPSSEEFSMAPALEYNFSEKLGMIAGCWFSILGRNTAQFRNAVLNVQYTY